MKIENVEAIMFKLPEGDFFGGKGEGDGPLGGSDIIAQPGWRGIFSNRMQTTLVRIHTDTGIVGYGEAHSPVAPEISAAVVENILRPMLLGRDPLANAVLRQELFESMDTRGQYAGFMLDAIAGADTALWDIKGKALDVPVHVLLGGPSQKEIPAYVSGIRGDTIDDKVATVQKHVAQGFTAFKYFAGGSMANDLNTISAIREAVGSDIVIAVDNLWNYDINEALTFGKALEKLGVAWYEAPIEPEDIRGNAYLVEKLNMAIANGETERTARQMLRWFEGKGLTIVQPDIARCGITEGRRICELAQLYHTPVSLHQGVSSGVCIASSLQVAAGMTNVRYIEFQPPSLEASRQYLKTPIFCEAGTWRLPEGPGLGIEIDEQALASLGIEV
jgi:L-alanine-DL-glutamate epimerase-like enolase superfamily enzyme